MDRRTLLQRAGGLLALSGLAGCLDRTTDGAASPTGDGSASPTAPGSGTDEPTDGTATPAHNRTPTEVDSGSTTATQTPAEAAGDASFTVLQSESGTPDNAATVAVDGETVVVEGTIPGSNGCYTAELSSVRRDGETLVVVVRSLASEATPSEACTQSLVAIDYRASVGVDARPDQVRVVHDAMDDRTTVADVSLTGTATPDETPTLEPTDTPSG